MFTQISKKTMSLVSSAILLSGMSLSTQAADINTDIVTSLETVMTQQTAKLIEVAKKEVMLSFEAQLAEMMSELSVSTDISDKQEKVEVASKEQIEEQNDSDIE